MAMTSIGFAKGKREWTIFPGGDYLMSSGRYAGYGQDLQQIVFECGITPDGRVVISHAGKTMDLGPLAEPARETEFGMTCSAAKEPEDAASLTEEHGLILWPAWFTWPEWLQYQDSAGHLPLWFRHSYHRIVWQKRSGARLEMLWRRMQTGFCAGWTSGSPTPEPSGLIHIAITP
jgi:hypothetical protein